ncbi:hypothetical protein [Aliiroseovarius crassostreae]|uniref:hypothetical protein n=1 Tax=Aliiroseovarius crassostreae TaxID=154981 RepID=UPI0021FDC547|nr:hypothetical protein [Aliiroseovarius crassostreae]UWP89721.1 hypothetical protein K3J57_03230 [Aliiroseovarius crassostreae]UWQ02371.1 hypothetical protein K3X44_03235 [Aliiroseovarius crassostreae]
MKRTILSVLSVFALIAFSGGAAADCPSKRDLKSGIRLERSSPLLISTFTQARNSPAFTEKRTQSINGRTENKTTTYLNALMPTVLKNDRGTFEFAYGQDLSTKIKALRRGPLTTSLALLVNGKQTNTGRFTLTFIQESSVKIGQCRYKTWVVKAEHFLNGRGTNPFVQHYSPELGISLGAIKLDADGTPLQSVEFDRISTVK